MFNPDDVDEALARLASLVTVNEEAMGLLDHNLEMAQEALRPLCDPNMELTLAAQASLATMAMMAVGGARTAVNDLRQVDGTVRKMEGKTTLH